MRTRFEVKSQVLRRAASDQEQYSARLRRANAEAMDIRQMLMRMSAMHGVCQSIKAIADALNEEGNSFKRLSNATGEIASRYERCEEAVAQQGERSAYSYPGMPVSLPGGSTYYRPYSFIDTPVSRTAAPNAGNKEGSVRVNTLLQKNPTLAGGNASLYSL
ncbi:MAG: hypothetical protein IJU50_10015 [Lachnospiraceae bacterium]|nr:hypothetical protein [Lachnospiraceae bacterium]